MKNKKGLVLSILLGCFIIGVSIPLFMTKHTKVKADALTDLTNTKWIINTTISRSPNGLTWDDLDDTSESYNLNFTSNDTNYTSLSFKGTYISPNGLNYYYSGSDWRTSQVYDAYTNTWNNQEYRTVIITGGTSATNSKLISWFQSNALQQQLITKTRILYKYWAPDGVIVMQDNERLGDNEIQYTVKFNEFNNSYEETIQTGLIFTGVLTEQQPAWSYIESINGSGINILYHGETNNIKNTMWLEFTYGDYMDNDLYNFMDYWGYWFDDAHAYLCGTDQGWVEGVEHGRALGQADGVEYTGLITGIFNGLGNILSIQVFPNITIGLLIGLPLLLGAFIIIIKILRG